MAYHIDLSAIFLLRASLDPAATEQYDLSALASYLSSLCKALGSMSSICVPAQEMYNILRERLEEFEIALDEPNDPASCVNLPFANQNDLPIQVEEHRYSDSERFGMNGCSNINTPITEASLPTEPELRQPVEPIRSERHEDDSGPHALEESDDRLSLIKDPVFGAYFDEITYITGDHGDNTLAE